jgi:multisubunit Na+/H+ antiporter MnhG subunit
VSRVDGSFRITVLIALLASAVCSLGLMLRAGQRQNSRILLLLFGIWVLSPFAAAAWAHAVSRNWSAVTRTTLYVVILVFTLSSLAIYGAAAFGHLRAKIGFIFLAVPFASWLLITIVPAGAALLSRKLLAGRKG